MRATTTAPTTNRTLAGRATRAGLLRPSLPLQPRAPPLSVNLKGCSGGRAAPVVSSAAVRKSTTTVAAAAAVAAPVSAPPQAAPEVLRSTKCVPPGLSIRDESSRGNSAHRADDRAHRALLTSSPCCCCGAAAAAQARGGAQGARAGGRALSPSLRTLELPRILPSCLCVLPSRVAPAGGGAQGDGRAHRTGLVRGVALAAP